MTRLRVLAAALMAFIVIHAGNVAHAQADPRQVLAGMIYQVSTGTENPLWYGPQLWQTIAMQTNRTGIYMALRQLGTVQDIAVNQWLSLPGGVVYSMTAQHQFGLSYWEFGIGSFSNRIEYANFRVGAAGGPIQLPGQPSSGEPTASTPTVGQPPPAPQPKPTPTEDQKDACKKFPSLC